MLLDVCLNCSWGYSSAGRALAWHARGQRFDPAYLHQFTKTEDVCLRFFDIYFIMIAYLYKIFINSLKLSPLNKKFFPTPAFFPASTSRSLSPMETDFCISILYLS